MQRLRVSAVLVVLFLTAAMPAGAANAPAPQGVAAIAQQAYIYGFPMVDLYRILFGYFLYPKSPAFKGPLNQLINTANVYTPADTTVQTPNSDTPYSFAGLDLRAEPYVLTLPPIEKNRYYSVQFVDLYTFNFDYVGSRTTGNGGGDFLIAGPNWNGSVPNGIKKVVRSDTELALALIRTQLFGPDDLSNVEKIQAGYKLRPLSAYVGSAPASPAPSVSWIAPLTPEEERSSPKFFDVLAFVLQFCPVRPGEVALRQSFASIGIEPGKPFTGDVQQLIQGMTSGQAVIDKARASVPNANALFGTPEEMGDNYLNRAVGAQYGILGNSAVEAVYGGYEKDSAGNPLTGSKSYTIHFAKGGLPPVRAFWSLTMYDSPQQLLVANSINRYLINSPMLSSLKRDADGGITLYIQHEKPSADKVSNWLPAPTGSFLLVLRCYWPDKEVLDGSWKQPPLVAQ